MTKEAATNATIVDVLGQLDGAFAPMAKAFGNAAFALWVGSGISFGRAPSLGDLILRGLEYLRIKSQDPATRDAFEPSFRTALQLSQRPIGPAEPYFATAIAEWPEDIRKPIVDELWNRYSQLLNLPIAGEATDYVLWDAINVRDAFANPPPPGCVHLSIAILVIEGVLRDIASANWDGFIEAAIEQLAGGLQGNLQVVVDPGHLRDQPGKARLVKFHGCIVHATQDEAAYRRFLVGSTTQIIAWPNDPFYAAIRNVVIGLATNSRALMAGLSLQDGNLQTAFSIAKLANPWPWPCDPQAHIFCEGEIGAGQRTMLQTVYGAGYNNAISDIEASALLVAWGEQVLLALVFKILADKFSALIGVALEDQPLAAEAESLIASLNRLRDAIATHATGERTAFAGAAITLWSRLLALFRTGKLPSGPGLYQELTSGPVGGIAQDQNARALGLGELGIGLSLLQRGVDDGLWTIVPPEDDAVVGGAFGVLASWNGANTRPIYFANSARTVITLEKGGAFANDNAIVLHADDAWHEMQEANIVESPRSISRSPGRTGTIGTQHVSLKRLIEAEATANGLAAHFVREASL